MSNNQPDPHAMVKEYRRAGADQEEPLSHDLRPPDILDRTMNYLLCNVIDKVEKESSIVGEWYDFVWSRTRAIRKDITQQHLCDFISVSLLEKSARFHIHCAQAFCEEDAATFDPNINNENLNKCIQSLKDFYNDLNLKGHHCPNEPEFRAYYLLLNLTNTVIIREIKFFDKRVRDSEQIKFVLKCFFAISTNDFTKFFQLVRDTTYLNACILHRYFNQVRYQAFRVLRNACPPSNIAEYYPGCDLSRLLGFSNEEELQVFCESIGIEYLDECVVLKKTRAGDNTAFNVVPVRSRQLVESKRKGKRLSEIINGAPLPPNPYRQHPLHDSFDGDGKLKKDGLRGINLPKVQFKFGSQEEKSSSSFEFAPPPRRSLTYISEEERKQMAYYLADIIFKDVLKIFVRHSSLECFRGLLIDDLTMVIGKEIFLETTYEVSLSIIGPTFIEERKRILRNRYLTAMEVVADQLLRELISEAVYITIRQITGSILTSRKKTMITMQSEMMTELFTKEVTDEIVKKTAKICHKEEYEKEELVKKMQRKRFHRLAKNCFILWRNKTAKAKRFRIIKATFPAGNMPQESFKMGSLVLKREFLEDDCDVDPSKKSKTREESPSGDKSLAQVLRPKMYAEQVASMSTSPISNVASTRTSSSFDELKRRISLEKDLSGSFGRNLEAYRLSVSLGDNNGGDIT